MGTQVAALRSTVWLIQLPHPEIGFPFGLAVFGDCAMLGIVYAC
jgi:hypothetical protein